jgi:uncharacterized protein YjbJ (UPF0337 family)
VSTRDKARNTARAAKGKAKRAAGKAAGNPYAQAAGARKKKANLKQAGEKLKDTPRSNGRTEAMDVTRTLIATSAAAGGEAVRPHAGHTGAL